MLSVLTQKRSDQREASEHPQGAVHWFLLFWFGLIFGQAMVYRFVSQCGGTQRYATEAQSGASSGFLSSFYPFLKPNLTPAVIPGLVSGAHGAPWRDPLAGSVHRDESSQSLGLCRDPAPLHFLHLYRRRS